MIWQSIKYLILAAIIILVALEVRMYILMLRFKKEGAELIYYPFLGIIIQHYLSTSGKDPAKWLKDRINNIDIEGKKMIVTNVSVFFSKPLVLLTNTDIVREFFRREHEIAFRKDVQPEPKLINLGMFYKHSENALASKGAFTDVFRSENLHKIVGDVQEVVEANLDEIINENKEEFEKNKHADVDVRDVRFLVLNFFRELRKSLRIF
jgi:hypothetical protein